MKDRKRYVMTVEMYVYGENDYHARMKADKTLDEINSKHVNAHASISEMGEQPFATMGYRKLDDNSRPSVIDKEADELPF